VGSCGVVGAAGGGGGGLELGRDGRGYVVGVGRCVAERRVRWGDNWWEGLRLHVEVWDGRDGLRMLSAEGRLGVDVGPNGFTNLTARGMDRREVVGPAFSAASRDPKHHRFADIRDYFRRLHEEGIPAELCTRVVVRDVRSGRRALLWESGKRHQWGTGPVSPKSRWAPFLPQDSFVVGLYLNGLRPVVYPPCGTGEGGEAVKMGFNFYVRPEAGQEGVPARHKLWRLAGADAERYGEHDCFAVLGLQSLDVAAVGRMIVSLLCT
jgi:hypothetical protein